jgi:uncharacterized protein YdaU (DUF1376 family)
MHYFNFNIKKYRSKTAHLSNDEDLAYRRLLEHYYDEERPIPNETQSVSRRLRMASQPDVVRTVLEEFFTLGDDNCWHHHECDEVIAKYHKKAKTNQINGLNGGRPPSKPSGLRMGTQKKPSRNLNQEPITTINTINNHTSTTAARGSTGLVFDSGEIGKKPIETLLLDSDLQRLTEKAPGWDKYRLMTLYDEFTKNKPLPKDRKAAFFGWVNKFTKNQPPA